MKSFYRHFNRMHLYVFLGFYLLFAGLTLFALARQSKSDWRSNWNTAATIGAITGPFTGAIARQFQGCCLGFSLKLFPYCAAFLVGGITLQLVPLPFRSLERPTRMLLWCVGLFGWFAGGPLSFIHAFS
ncbi:MAG TPA: hypothetical protein VEC99_06165 [Clostridia bacterium]|nr:hypothetical protein [Clostridia bacterium]